MQLKVKQLSILAMCTNLLILGFLCLYKTTLWADEAYSLKMIELSYSQIWDMTAYDVHPPLYYFILKTFTLVCGNSLPSMHACSLLAMICTLLLGFFPIRKLWGKSTSYLFILLLSILPVTLYFGIEIRMYAWLLFFVLAMSVYGYQSYLKPGLTTYTLTVIFAVCASYTHNYGLVSALAIYFILWLMCIIEKKPIKYLLISFFVFLILFSFWLPSLYYQVTSVRESYWIKTITLKNIAYILLYFSSAKLKGICIQTIHLAFFAIAFGWMYIVFKKRSKIHRQRALAALFFLSIYAFVFVSTLIFSLIFTPILIDRYLLSVLGCVILSMAIFIPSIRKLSPKVVKTSGIIALACMVIIYILMFINIIQNANSEKKQQDAILNYLGKNIGQNKNHFIISYGKILNIMVLSTIRPEYTFKYYFLEANKGEDWTSSPFKLERIYSLKDQSNVILFLTDLSETDKINKKYPDLSTNSANDIANYYTEIKRDTIHEIEIKTLIRKE